MMRKVIALFDEYQSKENAKHVIRSMKENARQGFWNGATAPLGYKLVEAEKRGTKINAGGWRLVAAHSGLLVRATMRRRQGTARCQKHTDARRWRDGEGRAKALARGFGNNA
jgi:hypothetical protein